MSNELMRELQIVQKMLSTLLKHQGLSQWCDCYAVGQNEGGLYISLFNSKAALRIGVVYHEQFKKLPAYIDIPEDAGEISTERQRVEKSGKLRKCPGFLFTRYKLNPDDPQDKWRFGDVLFASAPKPAAPETAQEPPQEQPQELAAPAPEPQPDSALLANPPQFTGPNDAIKWGMDTGVFADYGKAKAEYERIKRVQAPNSAAKMFAAWIAFVQGRVEDQALWHKPQAEPVKLWGEARMALLAGFGNSWGRAAGAEDGIDDQVAAKVAADERAMSESIMEGSDE